MSRWPALIVGVALSQAVLEALDDTLHLLLAIAHVFFFAGHRAALSLVDGLHLLDLTRHFAFLVFKRFSLLVVLVCTLFQLRVLLDRLV